MNQLTPGKEPARPTQRPRPARTAAWVRRTLWVTLGAPLLLLLTTTPAQAADGSGSPAALDWIIVKDSHGVSIWQYEMSLDRGGVTNPMRSGWAMCIDMLWQLYRGAIAFACWLVDWTLSMDWVTLLATPALTMESSLHQVVDRFGVTTTFLTIATVAAVLWMARGRWVLGLYELSVAMIIAALTAGVFANPVSSVVGEGGLIQDTRDLGMQVAIGLYTGETSNADPDQLRREVVGTISETFMRKPHQLVNFGEVIDGTKCEKAYDKTIKEGPFGEGDDLRNAMGDCKEAYGETAENPNAAMVMSLTVLLPAGLLVVLFTAVLCGVVLVAGINALYQALKMIVTLVTGLLPGIGRGSLWMTIAHLGIALVTIVFSVVFLAGYLLLVKAVFSAGTHPMMPFFVVDILLLVGVILFWKEHKRLKSAAARIAAAMAKRPGGGGATQLPQHRPMSPTDMYHSGKMAYIGYRRAVGAGQKLHQGYKKATGNIADGLDATGMRLGKFGAKIGNRVGGVDSNDDGDGPDDQGPGAQGPGAAGGPKNSPDDPAPRPSGGGTSGNRAWAWQVWPDSDPAGRLTQRLELASRGNRRSGGLIPIAATALTAAATGGTSAAAAAIGKQAAKTAATSAAAAGVRKVTQAGTSSRPTTGQVPQSMRRAGGPKGGTPAAVVPDPIAPGQTFTGQVVPGQVVNSSDAAQRVQARLAQRRTQQPPPQPQPSPQQQPQPRRTPPTGSSSIRQPKPAPPQQGRGNRNRRPGGSSTGK